MNNELSNLKYIKVSDGLENPTLDEDIFKYPVVGRLAMGMDAYRSPIDSKDGSDIINSVNPTLRVPKYGYVPRLGNKGQTGIKTALTTKIVVGIVGLGLAGAALLGLTGDDNGDNDAFQDNVNGSNITIPIIENIGDGVYNKSLAELMALPEYVGNSNKKTSVFKTKIVIEKYPYFLEEEIEGMEPPYIINDYLVYLVSKGDLEYEDEPCRDMDITKSSEELLSSGKGDCEDFALFQCEELKKQDYDTRMLIAYEDINNAHAVCMYGKNGKWSIADNKITPELTPVFNILDYNSIMKDCIREYAYYYGNLLKRTGHDPNLINIEVHNTSKFLEDRAKSKVYEQAFALK